MYGGPTVKALASLTPRCLRHLFIIIIGGLTLISQGCFIPVPIGYRPCTLDMYGSVWFCYPLGHRGLFFCWLHKKASRKICQFRNQPIMALVLECLLHFSLCVMIIILVVQKRCTNVVVPTRPPMTIFFILFFFCRLHQKASRKICQFRNQPIMALVLEYFCTSAYVLWS